MNLFALETVINTETMVSTDNEKFHIIELKESTGSFPFKVSINSGNGNVECGKSSYSFGDIKGAKEKFSSFISYYREQGFVEKISQH